MASVVVIPPSAGLAVRAIEVDAGSEFVDEFEATILDADVSPASTIVSGVLLVSPSDGRPVDEIYLEQMAVLVRPGLGSFRAQFLSKDGQFMGKFLLGYLVL